jgi:hypothetical protein
MCYSYILRSASRRPTYKTFASATKNYITVTPGKIEEVFLSEDYVTPTGNTNSSSDADFLADMFERTAQVYRHHLRYVCGIHKLHQSLLQQGFSDVIKQVNMICRIISNYIHNALQFVPISGKTTVHSMQMELRCQLRYNMEHRQLQ